MSKCGYCRLTLLLKTRIKIYSLLIKYIIINMIWIGQEDSDNSSIVKDVIVQIN